MGKVDDGGAVQRTEDTTVGAVKERYNALETDGKRKAGKQQNTVTTNPKQNTHMVKVPPAMSSSVSLPSRAWRTARKEREVRSEGQPKAVPHKHA